MSDFWDTYDQLNALDEATFDRLDAWDETPSITRDAMTSAEWITSAQIYTDRAERNMWLSRNLGGWGS